MNTRDASWVRVEQPKTTEHYLELAGGKQGRYWWQVLLAMDGHHNGKVFKRTFVRTHTVPPQTVEVSWETVDA